MRRQAWFLLLVLLSAPSLLAWGEKGHFFANEAATWQLHPELPVFFHQAYPRLVYLGYDPDRWRGAGPAFDSVNAPDHFLDYEYVMHLNLPPERYPYLALLESSGTLRRLGITNATPGFVPWRIAEVAELLEQEWRLWRRAEPGVEREQIEDTIVFLAGTLGHFVSDSANPHHASIHYNGWADANNPNRYPNDCETHGRFESQFVSREVEFKDVIDRLRAPVARKDYFITAIGLIQDSQTKIEQIYRLDRDGAFAYPRGTAAGRAFASDRIALGASILRDLWWSTWVNSATSRRSR